MGSQQPRTACAGTLVQSWAQYRRLYSMVCSFLVGVTDYVNILESGDIEWASEAHFFLWFSHVNRWLKDRSHE